MTCGRVVGYWPARNAGAVDKNVFYLMKQAATETLKINPRLDRMILVTRSNDFRHPSYARHKVVDQSELPAIRASMVSNVDRLYITELDTAAQDRLTFGNVEVY